MYCTYIQHCHDNMSIIKTIVYCDNMSVKYSNNVWYPAKKCTHSIVIIFKNFLTTMYEYSEYIKICLEIFI